MARLPKNIILNDQNNVRQEISISEWIGVEDLPDNLALAIAQDTIDFIKNRTARGQDIHGQSFESYSQSYKDSQAFKAAGKTNRVNLRLSSDMLESLDADVQGDKLVLFVPSEESPKAHGHMTGQEGKGPLPKRQFFGIKKEDFEKEILSKYKDDLKDLESNQRQEPQVNTADLTRQIRTVGDLFSFGEDDEL